MIRFEQVSKRYKHGHEALNNVSLHVKQGEMVFVTGHSGAGKSTLLKLIMRLEEPTSGQVYVSGQNLSRLPKHQVPYLRRHIGVVFQNHHLLSDRSIFDNVALPLVIEGYHPRDIGRRVRAALDKVGLLNKEKLLPMMLSGGEQQRVGIARAVVNKPTVLLADEPTGNLDPRLAAEIMRLFDDFNQVGVTVLVASHDLALITRMNHRLLTLQQGQLIDTGARHGR
jgi:cell division transport system ATP-binding protein